MERRRHLDQVKWGPGVSRWQWWWRKRRELERGGREGGEREEGERREREGGGGQVSHSQLYGYKLSVIITVKVQQLVEPFISLLHLHSFYTVIPEIK